MSPRMGLAVDGGNSKTDLALVGADGSVLAAVRGPGSSPQRLGIDGCIEVLERLLRDAAQRAALDGNREAVADVGEILMAGADLPEEERALHDALGERNWARSVAVANDTFAVLRTGTERGWGVAIVCGAGLNCIGVGPDGRQARFPALGAISGDWGGGEDVGLAGLGAAARSADGRGSKTTLERAVPAHFGLRTPAEVAEAIHLRRLPSQRVVELAPIVLAEAANDSVARELVDRLVAEIVALARVAMTRLDLLERPVEILLGGGLLRSDDGDLASAVATHVETVAAQADVRVIASPPIVGAALLALDQLKADGAARARLRRELDAAVVELEETPTGGAVDSDGIPVRAVPQGKGHG
jgi:N-acetylglucosamine kinase-like BadF-type ATPase